MHLHRRILLSAGSNGPRLSPSEPLSASHPVPSHVIIAVASAAAASLFLALVYYAVLRHRLRRPPTSTAAAASTAHDAASDAGDHPYWQVKTVGLDDAAIESIGSHAHCSSDDPAVAANNCTVCLGEVLDGDIVRLLPKCGHVFHVQCIDAWLRCHVSCPLCRTAVGVAAATAATSVDPTADVDEVASSAESPRSDQEEVEARVSVDSSREALASPELSRSVSLDSAAVEGFAIRIDEEKEGNCSDCANCSKDEGVEKGQSESGRGFLFSRLGRARSSSVLPL